MCGNPLVIKHVESFQKFASFEGLLILLCLDLLGSSKILHGLIWEKMTPAQ